MRAGGPQQPVSCLARLSPSRLDVDEEKRNGWLNHGILVVNLTDHKLGWLEREMIRQLGNKLYGICRGQEANDG